jgi:predicted metalloprotease
MRTDDLRPSSNVEDDREASVSRGVPGGAGGLSIGAVIIIGLISWYFGSTQVCYSTDRKFLPAITRPLSKRARYRR